MNKMTKLQVESAEKDFQRWMREARDFEIGITNDPPSIFDRDMSAEEKSSKLDAIASWVKTLRNVSK